MILTPKICWPTSVSSLFWEKKLIAERMRELPHQDFGEMLRTATRQDEWLLLLHGAVLGLAGGLVHLAIFG